MFVSFRSASGPGPRPADVDPADPAGRLAGVDLGRLSLAADPRAEVQIVADGVDIGDDIQAVSDQGGPFDRRRLLPVLDEVGLPAGEVEDAVRRVDAATAQALDVKPALRRSQDVGGFALSVFDKRVCPSPGRG